MTRALQQGLRTEDIQNGNPQLLEYQALVLSCLYCLDLYILCFILDLQLG